jgi:cytochrome c553
MPSDLYRGALGAACIALGLSVALPASAAGSAEAGAQKAATCAACHGQDGNSINPEWPSLAGQHANYIVRSLEAYKDGSRNNVLMAGQVTALSEQDMLDLGAYYEAQKPVKRTANPDLVNRGERLYRGGDIDRGISACIACHGPTGRGNPAAKYPMVSGQHAAYTAGQLKAYRAKERKSDPNQMMRTISALLNDEDIAAVAEYIQGLR